MRRIWFEEEGDGSSIGADGEAGIPLGFCEDLLCNVAQAVGEGKEMDAEVVELKKEGEMRRRNEKEKGRRGLEMERMMSFGNILDGDSGEWDQKLHSPKKMKKIHGN
ncbi:hypothetical protein SDJN03_29474, partial [Cucurbita argyrosperma subsp. sororia]